VHPLVAPIVAPGVVRALDDELRAAVTTFGSDLIIAFAAAGLPQVHRALGASLPVLSRCGDMTPEVIAPLLKADTLIVTTPAMAEAAHALGATSDQIALVPNFLAAPAVFHDYRNAALPKVGAMGRFVPRKGFHDLIAAAARLKAQGNSFQLVIGGDGPARADLQAQATKAGLTVDFPGWIGNAGKSEFLAGLDLFVVPSQREPFGNIQLEALQHGLPLITTATTGGTAIFAGTDAALLVPPGRIRAMTAALRTLLGNASARERLGRAGQALFIERYQAVQAAPMLDRIIRDTHARWHARARS
jgi:glycosyltransferase involved in cell wall biosynthesis